MWNYFKGKKIKNNNNNSPINSLYIRVEKNDSHHGCERQHTAPAFNGHMCHKLGPKLPSFFVDDCWQNI